MTASAQTVCRTGTRIGRAEDFAVVREAARDNWPGILTALAVNGDLLTRRHNSCPGCGGHDRFRYDDLDGAGTWICGQGGGEPAAGDGFALLQHTHGWTALESFRAVTEVLGLVDLFRGKKTETVTRATTVSATRPTTKRLTQPDESKRAALRRVWDASIPAAAPAAEPLHKYLRHRGLGGAVGHLPKFIRFHLGLEYWDDGKCLGKYPAMICRVDNAAGKPVSIHRTYLTEDGHKAPVSSPKKLMSPALPGATRGGAIRLFPATDTIAITEGVETALAVRIATQLPVWACVSTGGMAALKLPKEIRTVRIMADLDRSGAGELAARALTQRLLMEGRDARIVRPRGPIPDGVKSVDWLDVLQEVAA